MNTADLMWFVCGTVLPSLLISWIAVRFVRRWALRWQLVDRPGRKVHTTPTPMGGGLAIWLGVLVPLAVGQIVVGLLAAGGPAAMAGASGSRPCRVRTWPGLPHQVPGTVGAAGWRHAADDRGPAGRSAGDWVGRSGWGFRLWWPPSACSGKAGG